MKSVPMKLSFLPLALAIASLACAAVEPAAMPDHDAATAIVQHYLDGHGDFCLGKTDWPVDISALDERARGRDVLQMPVLEALGLVHSSAATAMRVEGPGLDDGSPPVPVAVKRYEPTPLGERYMRDRLVTVARADGDVRLRGRDLCAAHLALAGVVAVAPGAAPQTFVATYTYEATPAPWAMAADFQRAFPLAARVIVGSRKVQLKQAFAWKDGAWTPDGLAN